MFIGHHEAAYCGLVHITFFIIGNVITSFDSVISLYQQGKLLCDNDDQFIFGLWCTIV